jgi:nucleotide-binding universal stress UspA family protein
MGLKVILAAVTGQETDAATLAIAGAVAKRFNAHIDALHVKGDPRDAIPFLGEGASGVLIEQIMAAAERDAGTRSGKARSAFETWRTSSGIASATRPDGEAASVAWREETGTEEECMARFGRVSDLIIVGRPPSDDSGASIVVFETALFDTGKPVIVAPPDLVSSSSVIGAPATVFWTGSVEAAHAVTSAMPMLAAASDVTVVPSNPGNKPTETGALVEYLAWHGIRAHAAQPLTITPTAGADLLAGAKRDGSTLLVMGAYTQSRLRQLIYGSVTKHVLTNASLPVLMAH